MPTPLLTKPELIDIITKAKEETVKQNLVEESMYKEFMLLIRVGNFKMQDIVRFMPTINEELRTFLSLRKAIPHTIEKKHVRR